jgi:hypothetical protein
MNAAPANLDLLKKLSLPHPCEALLDSLSQASGGNITLDSIVTTAAKFAVYDGTDPSGLAGKLDYNELFRNSPNYVAGTMRGFTVADRFARATGVSAETMLGLNELGVAVMFIRPSTILSYSGAQRTALGMHETLHALGLEDDAIKTVLGIPQNRPSKDITDRFATNCFGVP